MQKKQKLFSPTQINLIVDVAIFLVFLIATAPRFSGIPLHEWLGIAFGAAIVTHLLLHWDWLVVVTRRFFTKAAQHHRLNYVLNALLFIDATLITFTGLMISEVALPLFGIRLPRSGIWRPLHSFTSDFGLFLVGLHIALHWQWLMSACKTYLIKPFTKGVRAPQLGAEQMQEELPS